MAKDSNKIMDATVKPSIFLLFRTRISSSMFFLILFAVAYIFLFGHGNSFKESFRETSSSMSRNYSEQPKITSENVLVITHNAPYIGPKTEEPDSYTSRLLGKNWGDWLWKYAAHTMLDNNATVFCTLKMEHCHRNYPASRIVHYHPFANDLAVLEPPHPDRIAKMNRAARIIDEMKDRFVALGIGTQSGFSKVKKKQDLGMAISIEIRPEDVKLHSTAIKFLSGLQATKQVALFRGAFTNKIAKLHGYHYGIETGCPTLMINHNVHLGLSLQPKYNSISERVGDRSLRIALNSNPEHPRIIGLCARIMSLYPNAILYAQIVNDVHQFRKLGIPFHRLRIFQGNVTAWMNSIKDMDIAFGPRIHGNMAALAATPAIPIFVLAVDHRVLELSRTMKVPHTDIYDRRLLREDIDVAELVRDYGFNGVEFDMNRCRLARDYVREFSTAGLHISSHVRRISDQC